MAEKTKTKHNPFAWVKKHKKLTALLAVLLAVGIAIAGVRGKARQAGGTAYQYVRTTVLSKTTLSDSVSVNGTVKSGSSASVTAADAVKTYKVTAVNVAVGDTVRKGDIIATLDTADVEKQIANAELDSSDNRTSAEKSYTRSVEDQAADQASAQQELAKAQQEYDTLGLNDYYSTMTTDGNADKTNREVVTDWYTRYAEEIAGYENTLANLQIQLTQAQQSGETDRAEGLQGQIEDYQNRESIAKAQCSIPELGLQGFDAVKKCYESIQNYADALQKAQESYQKSATNAARNVDDAATKLAQSQREDDKLTSLQTALEECTLTATMDGTITALNATVGDVCTSDATGDAVISGTLTRIDPVANDSGSFGATVTVNGQDSGLLIGISAKVEIVISEKDDVFTVPRDAVGTNEDGTTYVLRRTGGEGTDMTFEEVAVTEGDTNDYYVEITGDDLHEGDIIRATADLTQGIESSTDSAAQMMEDGSLYVGDGSDMPDGVTIAPAAGNDMGGGPGGPGGQ